MWNIFSPLSSSFTPPTSMIEDQLKDTERSDLDCVKKLDGERVELTRKAYVDLTRFGAFTVNDFSVYSEKKQLNPSLDDQSKSRRVYRFIEHATTKKAALGATKLLEQHLIGGVVYEVMRQKKLLVKTGSSEEMHAFPKTFKKIYVLNTKENSFEIVTEILVSFNRAEDLANEDFSKSKFVKIQVVVEGTLRALEAQDATRMNTTVHYTKEYQTERQALQAGFSSRKSYLR